MNYQIDEAFLTETLQRLVRINSVNPSLSPGAPGELDLANYIHKVLLELGTPSEIDLLQHRRANVVGHLKGKGSGRSLMLNAHMDTVGVEGMDNPFGGNIRDGRLYGRGAQDMKGSIAAILAAAKAIRDAGIALPGSLLLTFVADEEYASIGAEAIIKQYKTDAAIVTEPTALDVCIAHKGFGVFELKTHGFATHGSRYQEGRDANTMMGRVLTKLGALSSQMLKAEGHPLLGPSSMHVPLIKGGDALFIYARECSIMIERRTLPGETSDDILVHLENMIREIKAEEPGFEASVEPVLWRDSWEIARDAPIVEIVVDSAAHTLKKAPGIIGHQWWEDTAVFAKAGIDCVVLGPTGAGMHSAEEWVELDSVVKLAEMLVEASVRWCGTE